MARLPDGMRRSTDIVREAVIAALDPVESMTLAELRRATQRAGTTLSYHLRQLAEEGHVVIHGKPGKAYKRSYSLVRWCFDAEAWSDHNGPAIREGVRQFHGRPLAELEEFEALERGEWAGDWFRVEDARLTKDCLLCAARAGRLARIVIAEREVS